MEVDLSGEFEERKLRWRPIGLGGRGSRGGNYDRPGRRSGIGGVYQISAEPIDYVEGQRVDERTP